MEGFRPQNIYVFQFYNAKITQNLHTNAIFAVFVSYLTKTRLYNVRDPFVRARFELRMYISGLNLEFLCSTAWFCVL